MKFLLFTIIILSGLSLFNHSIQAQETAFESSDSLTLAHQNYLNGHVQQASLIYEKLYQNGNRNETLLSNLAQYYYENNSLEKAFPLYQHMKNSKQIIMSDRQSEQFIQSAIASNQLDLAQELLMHLQEEREIHQIFDIKPRSKLASISEEELDQMIEENHDEDEEILEEDLDNQIVSSENQIIETVGKITYNSPNVDRSTNKEVSEFYDITKNYGPGTFEKGYLTNRMLSNKPIQKYIPIQYEDRETKVSEIYEFQLFRAMAGLKKHSGTQIVIKTYTDSRSTSYNNYELTKQRGAWIIDYLKEHGNLTEKKIKVIYFGENVIRNKCHKGVKCSKQEHKKNNITEIELIKI